MNADDDTEPTTAIGGGLIVTHRAKEVAFLRGVIAGQGWRGEA